MTIAENIDSYLFRYDAVCEEANAITSFNARLESKLRSEPHLSGLSGILIDTAKLGPGTLCVTIKDALVRHTAPKRTAATVGSRAGSEISGGVDGYMQADTRWALLLWLPEIYNIELGAGTRLLRSIKNRLAISDGMTVLVDFGVEDEQDGFVKHFFPNLLGLRLSATGQFATGIWPGRNAGTYRNEIGFIYSKCKNRVGQGGRERRR